MSSYSGFDHLFDPVIVIGRTQTLEYFNHQASIFFKLPPRLLKQKSKLSEICRAQGLDLDDWVRRNLEHPDVALSPEIRISLAHDPDIEYYVILKLIPVADAFALVFHDKTVEHGLHLKYRDQLEELKKTHHQILQADKLSTLGELTATISHEINNPLTIASGHSEILRDYLGSKDPFSKLGKLISANQTVIESLERVDQIIKNMKDFLHQSEDKKEYCAINSLIETAIEWVEPSARKAKISIRRNFHEQKAVALVNRVKLEQVIINLIKNSIDAVLELNRDDGEIEVTVTKGRGNQQTVIDIIDNGPGLSDSIKKNLFKPFMSTKDAGHGTGLGLSICAKIVESHKGKLEFVETATGCHFRIRLPMIEIYSYTRNDKSLSGSASKQKILVLDNEVQILNVLNTFIQDEGFVFIGSSAPVDALAFLQKASIDLIITDVNMPEMRGDEFVQKVREAGYQGPILYMTGTRYVDQYNKDKVELDLDGLIIKPFSKEDVMKTIKAALSAKPGPVS
ncbi:MAG TPA: ATP-binding protein [Bacteriovoracaceae bacterium]|nr:ATP-binding protein [Bacteriovoracaceae bacterium]